MHQQEGNTHAKFKSVHLRTGGSTDNEFWRKLVNCQTNQRAFDNATSLAGTAFRIAQRHPISIDEEVRLQRYAQKTQQRPTGILRAFDVKPPVRPDRPRQSGIGHHRENWTLERLLKAECDVFSEMTPIQSEEEKKLYNSLLSDQEKSSQGTVTSNALKHHLVSRGLALSIKLESIRRPIIQYLLNLLASSEIDPELYEEECRALMITSSLLLKENEFHWTAGGHLKNPTPEAETKFFDNVSAHFEELNLTKTTDRKASPVELLGTPTDVFEGSSANEWLKRQVSFTFKNAKASGNDTTRSRGLKRRAGADEEKAAVERTNAVAETGLEEATADPRRRRRRPTPQSSYTYETGKHLRQFSFFSD